MAPVSENTMSPSAGATRRREHEEKTGRAIKDKSEEEEERTQQTGEQQESKKGIHTEKVAVEGSRNSRCFSSA